MPRYEVAGANIFWEIHLEGDLITTRIGEMGTVGRSRTDRYSTYENAALEYKRRIEFKAKYGYELVSESSEPAGAEQAATLEETLLDNPHDLQSYLVYADWLQARGVARGELIALECRLLDDPHNPELKAAAKDLRDSNRHELMGALPVNLELQWHLGFIQRARLTQAAYPRFSFVANLVQALVDHPSARLLRDLEVGGETPYHEAIVGLSRASGGEALKRLTFGRMGDRIARGPMRTIEFPDDWDWGKFGRLEELFFGDECEVVLRAALDAPTLSSLEVERGWLTRSSLVHITTGRLPQLTRLSLWLAPETQESDLVSLLHSDALNGVTDLGIFGVAVDADFVDALIASPCAPQLETLQLPHTPLSERAALRLVRARSRFGALRSLRSGADEPVSRSRVEVLREMCSDVAVHPLRFLIGSNRTP